MHCIHHHSVLFAFCLFKRLEYNFPIKKLFDKNYMLGLYYTQFNILLIAKVWIIALCELFDIACLKFEWCLFAQIILIVAFIYFSKPQKYLFKNTTSKNLHMGAKKTFMYFIFYSLSKNYFNSLFGKWHFNKSHMFY